MKSGSSYVDLNSILLQKISAGILNRRQKKTKYTFLPLDNSIFTKDLTHKLTQFYFLASKASIWGMP